MTYDPPPSPPPDCLAAGNTDTHATVSTLVRTLHDNVHWQGCLEEVPASPALQRFRRVDAVRDICISAASTASPRPEAWHNPPGSCQLRGRPARRPAGRRTRRSRPLGWTTCCRLCHTFPPPNKRQDTYDSRYFLVLFLLFVSCRSTSRRRRIRKPFVGGIFLQRACP